MKTILVTGATGFLGSHLVHTLLDGGYRVAILKRISSSLWRLEDVADRIVMFNVEDDIVVPFKALGRVDAIVHTATSYGRQGESSYQVFAANTVFPLRLLEAAISHGTELFVNTDTVLDKELNDYALSKAQFSEWGRQLARRGNISFINIRLEHMYGAGDDASKFTTYVIRSCMNNVDEINLTAGEQRRDFIYIDDAVAGYLRIIQDAMTQERHYSSYDLGSGKSVTIREFVETVHRLTGSTTRLNFGALPYRNNEVMLSEADISAAQSLGWECKTSLEDGIRNTIMQEKAR